ncbi:response regulator transcription factor [Pseudomonas protegens]|uniref:Response regulator transcription factor n=1 Tax=Pseudomonas protegens TaxID=380021 RepID=A0A7G8YDX5_9PSED|nr:winged helix-turn-helix domain-containing protein [Pseudomonas protegens]QNH79642.1 response regulator transcription factor [Pseudomonas protegens]QNL03069.1 response regulator transcription factor [Pseudomonas protegens]
MIEALPASLGSAHSDGYSMAHCLCMIERSRLQDVDIALFAPHIILLQVLPEDGLELALIKRIRRLWPDIGLILVTERGALKQHLQGYALGADYCLASPIVDAELKAVSGALMRRISMHIGPDSDCWVLDLPHRRLIAPDGKQLELSRTECLVLRCMQQAPKCTVSRRQLVEVLGEDYLSYDERRLEAIFSRLRRKMTASTGLQAPILSLRNQGYAFTASLLQHR